MAPDSIVVLDARSVAAALPDIFWVPDDRFLAAIDVGMAIKIRVLDLAGGDDPDFWDSAVVWVIAEAIEADTVHGTVVDSPFEIEGFSDGDDISVPLDRVFDALSIDDDGQLGINEERIRFGFGKRAVIGVTEIGPNGDVTRRQFSGIVSSVDPVRGVGLDLDGGGSFRLPPDGRALEEARPGSYHLRSTGETIEDPTYMCTFTVQRTGDGDLERGYQV